MADQTTADAAPVVARQRESSRESSSSLSFVPDFISGFTNMVKSITQNGGTADQAIGVMQKAEEQRQTASAQMTAGITQNALDAGQVAITEAIRDGAQSAKMKSTLTQANIDHTAVDNLYTATVQKFNELATQAEPLGAEIDKRMAVGFFDNPLEYLVNQTRLPGMVGQYNANVRERNRAAETLTSLQAMAGTQQSISQSMDADNVMAVGRAKAAEVASRAQAALGQVQVASADAAARTAAATLAVAQGNAQLQGDLAKMTATQTSSSEATSDMADAKKAEQANVDNINRWYKLIGRNESITPAQYKAMSKTEQTELQNKAGTGIISASFGDAAEDIKARGNLDRIMSTTPGLATWFKNTQQEAAKRASESLTAAENTAKITGKILNRDAHFKDELNRTQELYQAQDADMASASTNNPKKIQYAVVAQDPRLAGNTVAMYVNKYGPRGSEPVLTEIKETYLLDRMVAGINAGTLTPQVAAEQLKQFYTIGNEVQLQTTLYPLLGLTALKGYPIKTKSASFFANSVGAPDDKQLDLTNVNQVSAYLTKAAAVKQRTTIDFGGRTPGFN